MVAYFASGSGYINTGTSLQFTLPGTLLEGYGILVCAGLSGVTLGDLAISGGDPDGTWEAVGPGPVDDATLRTRAWKRVVADGDAGATITISWTSAGKCNAAWWAGSDVHPDDFVADWATSVEAATDATHDAPGVTPDLGRCWVVEFVADRGTVATSITAPADRVARVTQLGFGAGTVDMICADSGEPVPAGVASGAQTYTFSLAQANAVGWSILVAPPPLNRRVELALGVDPAAAPATWDGSWVDITDKVFARDPISIRGGRADQSGTAGPTRVTLTANNKAGHFTRTNPMSPYYGRLKKNTPIRVWVETSAGWSLRSTTFISEFAPRRHTSGGNPHMPLTSDGPLGRLGRGRVLRSALYRAITDTGPVAYWPMEDGKGSTQAASGLRGGQPLRLTGSLDFAEAEGPEGSAPLAEQTSGGRLVGSVPPGSSSSSWRIEYVCKFPTTGLTLTTEPLVWWTNGTIKGWEIAFAPIAFDGVQIQWITAADVASLPSGAFLELRDGQWHHIRVTAEQIGADIQVLVDLDGVTQIIEVITSSTLGRITRVDVDPLATDESLLPYSIGHIAIWAPWDSGLSDELVLDALAGHDGERAADRIARLSAEEGVPVGIVGTAADSEPMGPQPVDTYLSIVRKCEAADGGLLYEARDGSLAYQTRAARYNTPAVLTLDHDAGDVAALEPVDDDTDALNDLEVTRDGGSSARFVDEDSVAEIGVYPDGINLNLQNDEVLLHHARWRVHFGTVNDDLRYPQIAPQLQGRPDVAAAWADVTVGDPIAVSNPPPDLPPGDIEVYVEGYTETVAPLRWAAVANCSPAAPWRVGVYGTDHYDTAGSELAAAIDADDTILSVATTLGPVWTYRGLDLPFDVVIDGERMTVDLIGDVLNANPYFGVDLSGWSAQNATSIVRSTAVVHPSGVASMLITPNGSSANGGAQTALTGVGTVAVGRSYIAAAWVNIPTGYTDVRTAIDWYDAAGVVLSSGLGPQYSVAAATWTPLTATLVAPASASQGRLRVRLGTTPPVTALTYVWSAQLIDLTDSSASPQQLRVIRGVNAVHKSHSAGAAVSLADPVVYAL